MRDIDGTLDAMNGKIDELKEVLGKERSARVDEANADRLESIGEHDQRDLAEAMHAMAEGDLSRPVAPTTQPITDLPNDEIGAAGRSVNAILEANGA